jgi:predicted alpha/beta hydrolase family esterase
MKRAIIVHCWDGYPGYCWYQDTATTLEQAGFVVDVPSMPETHAPHIDNWVPKLKEVVADPDQDLYLIGHSAGVITILRYLEQLPEKVQIGGVVMVAGFTDDLDFKELTNFFEKTIDFEKIKRHARHFMALNSDDDPYVPPHYGEILQAKLSAELVIKHKMGHFSGHMDEEGSCTKLPDVAAAVLSMAKAKA